MIINIPRLSNNPSRVDRLIINSLCEFLRVTSLLIRIDLSNTIFYGNILLCMRKWIDTIQAVQIKRADEIVSISIGRQICKQAIHTIDDKG